MSTGLLPTPRRVALARAARRRRIAALAAIYAVLIAGGAGAMRAAARGPTPELRTEIEAAEARVTAMEQTARELGAAIAAARQAASTDSVVGDQPDWSLLLELLGAAIADTGALRSVRLDVAARAFDPDTPEERATVLLRGVARAQSDPYALALALESLGLFDRVSLVATSRTTLAGRELAAFEIECAVAATPTDDEEDPEP